MVEEVESKHPAALVYLELLEKSSVFFVTMEESKNKNKTQQEKTDEKDKQPAGKDKEKKEEQELVSVNPGTAGLICLSHCLHRVSVSAAAYSPAWS